MAEPQSESGHGDGRPRDAYPAPPPTLVGQVGWPPPSLRPPPQQPTARQQQRPPVAAPPPSYAAQPVYPLPPPTFVDRPATAGHPPAGRSAPGYPASVVPSPGRPASDHSAPPLPYAAPATAGGGEPAGLAARVAAASAGFVRTHTSRALSRNLRTVLPTAAEWPVLDARGVREMTVRQYLVWRRSWLMFLLPPAVLSAVFHLASLLGDGSTDFVKHLTWIGTIVLFGSALVQVVGYPAAAAVGLWWWDRHRVSRWALVVGWAASFLLPFGVALIPFHHFIKLEAGDAEAMALQRFGLGVVGGMLYLVTLLPVVMSIIPGVLRACVRIKSVLPESIVPGWFLVIVAPMYALVLLLAFIAVNQVAGNLLLIGGVLLLMAAPAVYLWKTPLFIRPVAGQIERRQLAGLQGVYATVVGVGLLLLLAYVMTIKVLDYPLVGDTSEGAQPHPALIGTGAVLWEAAKFVLGYLARSMYITAVAVDLFMLVNLSVWRNTKAFGQTPQAYAYDQIMADFEATAGGRAGEA
jgi:hypothetical protein